MKMITFDALERSANRFLDNAWEYSMYVLGNVDANKYPSPVLMSGKFYLSVYKAEEHQSEYGVDICLHPYAIVMDIIGKSLMCSIGDVSENHRISDNLLDYGRVKSIRGYDKRDYENDKDKKWLEDCSLIAWGQSGLIIECEKETIVVLIS